MAKTSLTERMLIKIIANKEMVAKEYMAQYLKQANVRYAAYSKTKPMQLVFYCSTCKSKQQQLSREAGRQAVVLIATGNERLGHIRAFISPNNDEHYQLANQCIYHVDNETKTLSVDGIQTSKGFRRIGVGAGVVSFVKDIAIASGCTQVVLDSVSTAVSFYKKMGFKVSDTQVCGKGSLTTMSWDVAGPYSTNSFTVNELNLMMQRGESCSKKI